MKSLFQAVSIKLSPVFIVLITVTFSIFAFAMINLIRLPTPEEKRLEFTNQMEAIIIAEQAQAMGGTVEEVKFRNQENNRKNKLLQNLIKAINQQDDIAVSSLIHQLKNDNKILSNVFTYAVNSNNEHAFRTLLETGISCDYPSLEGTQAFMVAISSENPAYLKILFEKKCRYSARTDSDSLGKRIIQSPYPEKIFQLPENLVEAKYRDEGFLKAINKKMSQQVITMLNLSANPNATNHRHMSALYLSLRNNMPQVALRLIQKGAKIESEHLIGRYEVLSWAIMKGYLDIADEIINRNPKYIQQNNLDRVALSAVLYTLKDKKLRQEALTMLLQNGVEPQKLENGGIRWLIKAVELQDPILVKQLLDTGIDPNKRSKMRIVLGVAESIDNSKSFDDDKDKIIALLKQYGATNNFLAIVRDEKGVGVDINLNCRLGRVVKIETKTVAEKYMQRSQNNPEDKLKNTNQLVMCSIATANCTNQGFGVDSCMRSIQVCSTLHNNQAPICCSSSLKKRYFEARCSGLNVSESISWMALANQSKPSDIRRPTQ